MAKGQQRSNREKKKPKAVKEKAGPAAPRFSKALESIKKGGGNKNPG